MNRELSDDQVSEQADRLADYVHRGGDPFRWISSKSFALGDREAIMGAYWALRHVPGAAI